MTKKRKINPLNLTNKPYFLDRKRSYITYSFPSGYPHFEVDSAYECFFIFILHVDLDI